MRNPIVPIILVRTGQASVLAWVLHALCGWPLTGPHALGFVFTPLLCVYFVFVFVGHWNWGLPILTSFPGPGRVVALTFDDGPSEYVTPRILDTLQKNGACATFFVLGQEARTRPNLVRRMAREGHEIGLHGDSHRPLVLPGWGTVRREIETARRAVEGCTGAKVRWLRPPYGFKTLALPVLIRQAGLGLTAWSINSRDYHAQTAEEVADAVLAGVRPGAIVLLHDGDGQEITADALPLILAGLRAGGYRCVSLPSLTSDA